MSVSASPHVFDVDEADFQTEVVERSASVPVVVDFWADWCGPCKTLGPMLEASIDARDGGILLAKVDVDRNQRLAQTFRVQGIPQVIAFRDGRVAGQFTGVVPQHQLDTFLDDLLPTEADQAVARARVLPDTEAEVELRRALELDPDHREAAIGLAEKVLDRDPEEALRLVAPHRPDPAAEAVVTRIDLAGETGDLDELRRTVASGNGDGTALLELGRGLAARGEHEEAMERLLAAVELGGDIRDPAREQLIALFGLLGDDDERVKAARPRLARALF